MLILTGANSDTAKRPDGKIFKGFSFREVIMDTVGKAEELGYDTLVYDLGSLGLGTPFPIANVTSKAVFKPEMIKACMKSHDDIIAYIDADAQLCGPIDEITEGDYDVGVTLRDAAEIDNDWYRDNFEWTKYINAGVIFFKPTDATKKFIEIWKKITEEVGDDQVALNKLACPDYYPEAGSIVTIDGIRFKYFPCKQYNYYYFNEGLTPGIKIMHFKGIVRHFYPFNWKKKLYCKTIVPILQMTIPVIKGFLPRSTSIKKA